MSEDGTMLAIGASAPVLKQSTPPFAPLPHERAATNDFQPFRSVGIDYTCHFQFKDGITFGKCYILLFTCTCIRAVHLEVVRSMNSITFVDTFERFAARRGMPRLVISDNFRTFKHVAPILGARHGCRWRFNTPSAPWQGGFFERLVRSVKGPLKTTLKGRAVTFDKFQHVVTLTEYIVNSRPITAGYKHRDEPRPLSPNDFLIYRGVSLQHKVTEADKVRQAFVLSLRCYRYIWAR